MSNLFKSSQISSKEKLILNTKPILSLAAETTEEIVLSEAEQEENELQLLEFKKKEYLSELNSLQAEITSLQHEIEAKQTAAKEEIALWWQAKEDELQVYTYEKLKQAEEQGFDVGYQKACQQLQAEYEQKLGEAQALVEQAYAEKSKIIEGAEPFLLSLSVKIARKIIGAEIQQDPQQLMHMVRQGLQQISEKGEVTIQVCAEQYALLLDQKEELLQYIHPEAQLKIIPDKTRVSGCMIHTENGSYDVSIDSQLNQIKTSLLEYYEERANQ